MKMRLFLYTLGLAMVAASVQASLGAWVVAAPEIDGGTLISGLGLLTGGALLLRARYRR